MVLRLAALASVLPALVSAATDPCAKIAGKAYVTPADALACQKAFPFNETLRQNVLTNVARVFDFFTFEGNYNGVFMLTCELSFLFRLLL
jgi:hypothetical protein